MSDPFLPAGRSVDFGRGFNWISDAFGLFSRAALGWIAFAIILFVILLSFSMVPLIGQFLFNLISPIIVAGALVAARNLERAEAMKPEDFMAGFSGKPVPLLILGALYMAGSLIITLVFVAIVAITVGTALLSAFLDPPRLLEFITLGTVISLLLAALIALALYVPLLMAYWFAVPLVHFHDMAPIDAMKTSFMGCLKNMLPFLLYGIVSLVLLILAVIPLGLGLLVMVPVLVITVYTSYQDAYLDR
ncbi:MAG: BPSS1780 family membrane protein [Burkholderiales bacterium]|nr:BPSS1780 family membrane protein [Burkholderiales bacterium]